jgi:predicted ATPase/DNA-binding SARP family transcriptional activator/DNA-binding CsgD family transcriptional regulator
MHSREDIQVVGHRVRGTLSGVPDVVCVRLLGGFRVSVGSRSIEEDEWHLRKAASIIKLLALAPRHRLHREFVMELLWSGLTPKAAANNLRYTLHTARRILQPDSPNASQCLRLRSEQLALYPEGPMWVDVEAFEEAAAAARLARSPAAYEAAVGLYAGDLLPEDRYEEWAADQREELRMTYLALFLELAELYEERAELGPAIEALRRAVKSEPTHEGAHEELMRLYARYGQRQGTLPRHEPIRGTLQQHPDPEAHRPSQSFCKEILTGRPPSFHSPRVDHSTKEPLGNRRHNLPAPRTSFVGRERELAEIKRALTTTRLLTLTGAAGSGKTRLALELGRDLVGAYPEGVWIVELAALFDPELVCRTLAATLGVYEWLGRCPTEALAHALCTKTMLLILDNCEHLIDHVARVVDTLIGSCPHLRILTTSRETLGVAGEVKWRVSSLSFPDAQQPSTIENLSSFESVQLFLQQSRCHHPLFVLTPRNVRAVGAICRQLEGIPLAIELAAARAGMFSAEQLAFRLKDPLKLLTTGDRMAPARQQTMRAALDWSFDLLNEAQAKLFTRLSVCSGSWTLETAEAVGAGDGIDEDDVLDLLSALVNKSLVAAEASEDGAVQYRMLDPVRQYGRERLEESEGSEPACRRHIEYGLEGTEAGGPQLVGAPDYAPSNQRLTPMPEGPPSVERAAPLTRRESEVARLVGLGLTNRQICARLVLSEHTVAKHVCNILKKLGLHSRTQIATWVIEQPLRQPSPH